MRILFIGAVEFSFKALEKLIYLNENIVGVCTKYESEFNSDFKSLAPVCRENSIPFKYAEDINSKEIIEWIMSLNPDVVYCFGWSNLIKKELLNIPKLGVIGFHPAKLPMNRGRHPIIWALVLGLEETASTFFFMDEGADDGDILSQEIIKIEYKDNASSLYQKITNTALSQIEKFTVQLKENKYNKIKQNHSISNLWRKRNMKDGEIDFRMTSNAIYNLVRGLSEPYVGAHITVNGNIIKIWEVEEVITGKNNLEPGLVINNNPDLIIKCYGGAVKIKRHDFIDLPKVGQYL